MQQNILITFDDVAQTVYDAHSEFGNGEFVFVDANGTVGYL